MSLSFDLGRFGRTFKNTNQLYCFTTVIAREKEKLVEKNKINFQNNV